MTITLYDRPAEGGDWRDSEGFGWIFKAWFSSSAEAADAREAIANGDWVPERRGLRRSKVRVPVKDGYDGERLIRFVTSRWPEARIQLRND